MQLLINNDSSDESFTDGKLLVIGGDGKLTEDVSTIDIEVSTFIDGSLVLLTIKPRTDITYQLHLTPAKAGELGRLLSITDINGQFADEDNR